MKLIVKKPESYCKGCVWLTIDKICSFKRCVKHEGFVSNLNKKVKK